MTNNKKKTRIKKFWQKKNRFETFYMWTDHMGFKGRVDTKNRFWTKCIPDELELALHLASIQVIFCEVLCNSKESLKLRAKTGDDHDAFFQAALPQCFVYQGENSLSKCVCIRSMCVAEIAGVAAQKCATCTFQRTVYEGKSHE